MFGFGKSPLINFGLRNMINSLLLSFLIRLENRPPARGSREIFGRALTSSPLSLFIPPRAFRAPPGGACGVCQQWVFAPGGFFFRGRGGDFFLGGRPD